MASLQRRLRLAFLAALTLGGCDCNDGVGVGIAGRGAIAVEPPIVDLGRPFVGFFTQVDLTIRSVGTLPVGYTARFGGPAPGFVLVNPEGRLPPSGEDVRRLFFRPDRPGRFEAVLEFVPSDPEAEVARVRLLVEGRPVPDCEDGNGCTEDRFDVEREACVHEAVRVPCDDFNGCTVRDICVEGVCLGEGTSCDDGDICTEDLCDPQQGCVNRLRADCDDGNPCTEDTCDPVGGCRNVAVPDGTPCDDFEMCTEGDICVMGSCRGVVVPEGTMCDDGDPCSLNDQCLMGACRDPTYMPPGLGDLKFSTPVGPLGPLSAENPIVAPDGVVFVGLTNGVVGVDECGLVTWTATLSGPPRFSGAVALPGLLSVPVGSDVVDLDSNDGTVLSTLDLQAALPPTDLTGPVAVRVLDLAVRASGALVASVARTSSLSADAREGYIVEVDAPHQVATTFAALGPRLARRVLIDRDESLVLLTRDGGADRGVAPERVLRLGIEGLTSGSWSAGPIDGVRTDLALGAAGEVLWTSGLTRISTRGELRALLEPASSVSLRRRGAPITFGPWTWAVEPSGAGGQLTARTSTGAVARRIPLDDPNLATTPVVDRSGRVFVLDRGGVVRAFDADANPIFATDLGLSPVPPSAALTLTEGGVLIVAAGTRVYGVRVLAGLALSSWPRHRRDNFSTGHR